MGNKFINYYKQYYGGLTKELSQDELKIATINKINDSYTIYIYEVLIYWSISSQNLIYTQHKKRSVNKTPD